MPRRRSPGKRPTQPDPKYKSVLVTEFINALMKDGKKSVAERILYDALDKIEEQTGENGLTVFRTAVDNVKPALEVRSRRVGGSTYQVPVEVRPNRRTALAIRWIIGFSRARTGPMADKLAAELIAASRREGAAVKKREDTHKMADANKAFAHYRW